MKNDSKLIVDHPLILFLMLFTVAFVFSMPTSQANEKTTLQEPPILPVGTILFIKTTKAIHAQNFKAGDHFFAELSKDITQKGKVLISKGTIVQMEVLVSENKKRRTSSFAVTVGGFIIDNYLQLVKTETKAVITEDQAGQTIKKAAIGAGIGAAFDGGTGAGRGAAIGAATGLLKPGEAIYFPAGTEGSFQLKQSLKVTWL
ncbi:hypothetical protein [Flavivirga eckloniae]|uniref:Uncharacterized protein n=1 Tax=Flavivirga eckloniae TaxID=1803846 RepID=A0A2K9PSH0_9FLAO|nr:hypothetical protein [Flavivirga eckloniae]AUP79989.1 hypothetical protein C1H87_15280 [Flavivirga eckloniae]